MFSMRSDVGVLGNREMCASQNISVRGSGSASESTVLCIYMLLFYMNVKGRIDLIIVPAGYVCA